MAESYLLNNYNTILFDVITLIEESEYTVKEDFEQYFKSLMEKWTKLTVKTKKDGQKVDIARSIISSNFKIMKTESYAHYWIQANNRIAALQMNESFTNSLRQTTTEAAQPIVKRRKLRAATKAAMSSVADPAKSHTTKLDKSPTAKPDKSPTAKPDDSLSDEAASSSTAETDGTPAAVFAESSHASTGAANDILDDAVTSIADLKSINENYDQSLFDEDPFNISSEVAKSRVTVINNKKVYDFHAPAASRTSPNKPAIRKEEYSSLKSIFEIVLSTNRLKCSESELTATYDTYRQKMTNNSHINNIGGAMDELKRTVLNRAMYDEATLWASTSEVPFVKMMKRILADFLITIERAIPISSTEERTFMAETVVLWFRAFGVMAGVSFKWFENHNEENKASWLPLSDYRLKECKTKLFDGLGLSEDNKMAIFIESSGNSKNVNHRVEDSLKNMKNCTDFLKHLSCVYKQANIKTFQLLKIPCINVISNRMTLCLCSVSTPSKWSFVEVHSTLIPTTAGERPHFVKVFDLFALLKETNENNENAIHNLELENLGLSDAHYTTVDQYFSNIHHSIIP